MREIIQKAIEGRYERAMGFFNADGSIPTRANPELFFLDPKFWQSFKDWKDWAVCLTCGTKVPVFRECNCDEEDEDQQPNPQMAWEWYWHKFIHIVANGGYDSAVEWLRGELK